MNLGRLIEELERQKSGAWVMIDRSPIPLQPHAVDSYRGYYEQLAIACGPSREHSTKVGDLLTILREAVGKTFTGYKGGEYRMTESTPVWLANYGETGTRCTGVRCDGECMVYLTWDADD